MKFEETLGLVNVILYLVHAVVFSILGYRQNKSAGIKSTVLVLVFLLVLFFISLQVGGLIAQMLIFFTNGEEMTSKLKAIHDTIALSIATLIESPIWFIFLKKKKKQNETENDSPNSP